MAVAARTVAPPTFQRVADEVAFAGYGTGMMRVRSAGSTGSA